MIMNNQYIQYSLDKIKEWVRDSLDQDITPKEIYDAIKDAVSEDYYYHKHYASKTYELLCLLNGNAHLSCNKDESSNEVKTESLVNSEGQMTDNVSIW